MHNIILFTLLSTIGNIIHETKAFAPRTYDLYIPTTDGSLREMKDDHLSQAPIDEDFSIAENNEGSEEHPKRSATKEDSEYNIHSQDADPDSKGREGNVCKHKYSCADCSTVRLCGNRVNGTMVETTIQCKPSSPFCNEQTGTCDTEPQNIDTCGEKVNMTFVCQTDGYFPNPDTINKFYICYQGYAYSISCGQYQYDINHNLCTEKNELETAAFECGNLHGVKVKHTLYDRYYAYCVESRPTIVDKCAVNYYFNFEAQTCLPSNHEHPGIIYIPDEKNCSKYYTRFADENILRPRKCALGYYFDSHFASCFPDETVCDVHQEHGM